MIYELLSVLSLLSVSAYGNEVTEKIAISTESFNRLDTPVSSKFTTANNDNKREIKPEEEDHEHPQLKLAVKRFYVSQYTPLEFDEKSKTHRENQDRKLQSISEPTHVNMGRHVYSKQGKPNYEHLEPKPLKEDDNVSQKYYRSFMAAHEVEAFWETTGQYLEQGVDTFAAQLDYFENKKGQPPKFVYIKKHQKIPYSRFQKRSHLQVTSF